MKLPDYLVKDIFSRLVHSSKRKNSMGRMLLNGDCPLCGDSRGRFYAKDYGDDHMVYCHNCNYSGSFKKFLKDHYPLEYDNIRKYFKENLGDFIKDTYDEEEIEHKDRLNKFFEDYPDFGKTDRMLREYIRYYGFPITKKQEKESKEKFRQKCIKELVRRKIPKSIMRDFYVMTGGPLRGYVGIPFWDRTGEKMIHLQGRLMYNPPEEKKKYCPKYNFLRDQREWSKLKIEIEGKALWGLHRVNLSKPVIINEGTLDACAFKNGLATCGATLSASFIEQIRDLIPNRIWAVDSFWEDPAGRDLTRKLIAMGEKCFILPHDSKCKDANDLLRSSSWTYIPLDFVEKNIYNNKLQLAGLETILKMKGVA